MNKLQWATNKMNGPSHKNKLGVKMIILYSLNHLSTSFPYQYINSSVFARISKVSTDMNSIKHPLQLLLWMPSYPS